MATDIRFKHPFTCIIGPTGSKKSTFCIRLLQYLDTMCKEPDFRGGIVWCYSEQSAVPHRQLAVLKHRVRVHEGLPENFDNPRGLPCLFIRRDLLNEVYSRAVCDLFTKGSHLRNLSVILITQNIFHQAPHYRDISLNAKYLVAIKNVRDRNQFAHLARQVLPQDSASLRDAYREATRNPHGYLILEFALDTDDRLRYRTNVVPSEYPPIIYAPVTTDDQANKIDLSSSAGAQDGKTPINKGPNQKLRQRACEIDLRVCAERGAQQPTTDRLSEEATTKVQGCTPLTSRQAGLGRDKETSAAEPERRISRATAVGYSTHNCQSYF